MSNVDKSLVVLVDVDSYNDDTMPYRELWVRVGDQELDAIRLVSTTLTKASREWPGVGDGGSQSTHLVSSETYQRLMGELEVVEEVGEY